jgi:hypothetical protein
MHSKNWAGGNDWPGVRDKSFWNARGALPTDIRKLTFENPLIPKPSILDWRRSIILIPYNRGSFRVVSTPDIGH